MTELKRPAFHYAPERGWMNDPNGLVFYKGEYHLFYQYNPNRPAFGAMHWGHAVSNDLVHWTTLPIALSPDEHGLIYSGCVIVDWRNTSGFGRDGEPPLIALFTYHDTECEAADPGQHQSQALAYSTDAGRTWTKYSSNPVLPNTRKKHDFRDPKVIWHEQTQRWIMALATGAEIELFGSTDLKRWAFLSAFTPSTVQANSVLECPDLFTLKTAKGDEKWVLLFSVNPGGPQGGSGAQYFVGEFDGAQFQPEDAFEVYLKKGGKNWVDWGTDNYAGVTWSDIPQHDGRRIFIGWMSNWLHAESAENDQPWRGMMTAPRELTLRRVGAAWLPSWRPVRELENNLAHACEANTSISNNTELKNRFSRQFR
ncbi:MAG: glycoside hydrolase family 32 protein, partial [Pseudomonadota bacterium]